MRNQTTTSVLALCLLSAPPTALAAQSVDQATTNVPPVPGSLTGFQAVELETSSAPTALDEGTVHALDGQPPPVGTAVPEPATFVLVGAGLLSLATLRRRRTR